MTDTTTAAPTAGWYSDPTDEAVYRWWDGSRWTDRTRDAAPSAGLPPASAEVIEHAAAVQNAAVQNAAAAQAAAPAAAGRRPFLSRPGSAPLPSRRSLRNLATVPPGTPTIGPRVAAPTPYVPLNPLTSASTTPPASPDTTWHTPEAWIANAPATPDYAVYGTGMPFGRGPRTVGAQPDNRAARVAITFVVIGVLTNFLLFGLINAGYIPASSGPIVVLAVAGARLVAGLLVLAAFPLAIVGLVKAHGMRRLGHLPKGRTSSVLALIASSLLIVLAVLAVVAVAFIGVQQAAIAHALTPQGPAGTVQTAGGTTAGGVPTPVMAVPGPGGTLTYSRAVADRALTAAVAGSSGLHMTASCPASVPGLAVGSSFTCKVRMGSSGGAIAAHVSVLDASGRSTVVVGLK